MRRSKYIQAFREEVGGENFLVNILKQSLSHILLSDTIIFFNLIV